MPPQLFKSLESTNWHITDLLTLLGCLGFGLTLIKTSNVSINWDSRPEKNQNKYKNQFQTIFNLYHAKPKYILF